MDTRNGLDRRPIRHLAGGKRGRGTCGHIAIGANGRGFTSNGGENKVGIVDLKTLTTLSKVETGANPDAILYVPSRKEVYAFNHTGESATIIDAEKGTAIATVKLGGQAETGQADAALGRVFVNIEDKAPWT
jgi:DNA-binding beta-propeller fold protein YncE